MRPMVDTTSSTRSPVAVRRPQAGADTDEPYIPHFRSLTMPGLVKGPILPESVSKFFRKLLRRTDTPAADLRA